MSDRTISVLMSVHNGEAYLREAVDSVLAQTYEDFELLLVDDASTDKSSAILDEYTDARLQVFSFPNNLGLVHALNFLLGKATGKYIARMDADDICEPDRLARQVAMMEANPSLVLLGSAFTIINQLSEPIGITHVLTDNDSLQHMLFESNQFCHPSAIIRSDALSRTGAYRDLGGRYAQDYDLWLRLAEQGDVANLAEPLLRYRTHSGQVSIAKMHDQMRAAELYRILARQRREHGQECLQDARKQLRNAAGSINEACAREMLSWSKQCTEAGRQSEARDLIKRAFLTAPFSRPVFNYLSELLLRRSGLSKLINR